MAIKKLKKTKTEKKPATAGNKKNQIITKDEFRKHKSTGHPAYIYEKVGNKYKFIGITHAKITNGVKNIKLEKNPNPKDIRPAYFRPEAKKDKINNFKNKELTWSLSAKDKKVIRKYKK